MEEKIKYSGVFIISDLFSNGETIPKAIISYIFQRKVSSDVFICSSVYDII